MSTLIKYSIFIIVLLSLILFYFLYTPLGNQQIYSSVSYILTKKSGLDVDVESINIQQYPYLEADMLVEDKYNLKLKGFLENDTLDMDYILTSNCLQSSVCTIDDEINIIGHLTGPLDKVKITGEGKTLDGNISYEWLKQEDTFKDINLVLNDINSSKLFTLLGQTALLEGKANARMHFDILNQAHKRGEISYEVKKSDFSGLLVDLHANIDIEDNDQTFIIDVVAPELTLHLTKGRYDQGKNTAHAFYTLDIQELSHLEKLLGYRYAGPFYASGEIEYDEHIIIKGFSKSFDGLIDFIYEKDTLNADLTGVPFRNFITKLSYTPLLDANTTGQMGYDFLSKRIMIHTKLKNAKFLPSGLLDTLSEKSGIDMRKEVFDDSSVNLTYKDDILTGDIRFANKENHLLFNDAKVNLTKRSMESTIDLQTQKYKLSGKTYVASLDEATPMQNALQDTYIRFNGTFNTHYKLALNGLINDTWANMDYTLSAARFPGPTYTIEDDVNLTGHINGPFSRLHISGEGEALDGHIRYDGVKINDNLENFTLSMDGIHSVKLSTLLGQKTFPKGRADLHADFEYLSKENKKGTLTYSLEKSTLDTLPFSLYTQIDLDNSKQTFTADVTMANAKINITKGYRDTDTNTTSAFYVIDVKDLTPFEKLLGYKYHGPFYAMGEATYHKHFKVQGLSKTFGGMLDFVYEKDQLDIDLDSVSFKQFMGLFPFQVMIDGDTTGKINYDFINKRMVVNTKLKNAKFLHSDVVSNIYKKADVNMLLEEFDDSTLEASYQNDILQGDLKLSNDRGHFFLTNTIMNTHTNTINAYFDLRMQEQVFSGKVYGALDDPEVDLNMKKLIRHKMDKQMDSMIGKGNRKMMEKMPMGEASKDAASGVAGGFMGIFF
ncbi:hypothetical protein TSL6_00950 [Sulfurovum sp. TSL6]|uniref:hypothetical protein n=1 Tax=Sulfurovum sp. TSL6 TaxID=2826995 RepID=UPI001CC60851|nr:hypothetical protein [Sulfurovum sp. TSL6]GIT99588.1 hypothetical protein TSL6_00950 [Sulfurovum sp. TSL6]